MVSAYGSCVGGTSTLGSGFCSGGDEGSPRSERRLPLLRIGVVLPVESMFNDTRDARFRSCCGGGVDAAARMSRDARRERDGRGEGESFLLVLLPPEEEDE